MKTRVEKVPRGTFSEGEVMELCFRLPDGKVWNLEVNDELDSDFEEFSFKAGQIVTDLQVDEVLVITRTK